MYHIEQGKLGALLVENHQLLQQLGVSHPVLDEIVTHVSIKAVWVQKWQVQVVGVLSLPMSGQKKNK